MGRFLLTATGYPILCPKMAVEELGGRQTACSDDGPGHRDHLRGGEEAEEEASSGVSL